MKTERYRIACIVRLPFVLEEITICIYTYIHIYLYIYTHKWFIIEKRSLEGEIHKNGYLQGEERNRLESWK